VRKMDKITIYAAVNTKIRVLEKQFLERKDYLNLLEKRSVGDASQYLKENEYYILIN